MEAREADICNLTIPFCLSSKRNRQKPSRRQSLGLRGLPGFYPAVHPVGCLSNRWQLLDQSHSQECRNPSHQLEKRTSKTHAKAEDQESMHRCDLAVAVPAK
jgi:hypothetical protein